MRMGDRWVGIGRTASAVLVLSASWNRSYVKFEFSRCVYRSEADRVHGPHSLQVGTPRRVPPQQRT